MRTKSEQRCGKKRLNLRLVHTIFILKKIAHVKLFTEKNHDQTKHSIYIKQFRAAAENTKQIERKLAVRKTASKTRWKKRSQPEIFEILQKP